MTDKDGIAQRDLERLSAFLDGELNPADAEKLASRLAADEQLSSMFEALRTTATIVGSLPEVRPPRSFALTPDMVRPRRAYPLLRLTTAVAALGFVLVIGADLLISNARSTAPSDSEQAFFAADQLAEQELEDFVALPTQSPAPLVEEAEAELAAAAEPLGEAGGDVDSQGLFRSEEQAASAAEGITDDSAEGRDALMEGAPAAEEALKAAPGSAPEGSGETSDLPAVRPSLDLLRVIELGLAAALIVLIGLTLWVRQRG